MTLTTVERTDHATPEPNAAPFVGRTSPTAQILHSLKSGELKKAWLLSDKLCRSLPFSVDALMLRSAVFAAMGDKAAADAELKRASEIDPESPSLNRARLKSQHVPERIAAARTLLRHGNQRLRDDGIAALVREKVICIGLFSASDRRLTGDLQWNGDPAIEIQLKTDVGTETIKIQSDPLRKTVGFRHSAQFTFDISVDANVAIPEKPYTNAVFEPDCIYLPPSCATASAVSGESDNRLLIIVPVYDDLNATRACLESLVAAEPKPGAWKIVAVDDLSPDWAISEYLKELAATGRITMLRNTLNLGFSASVNRGLKLRSIGQDVLLLNADTIVPRGAIDAMARHARSHRNVATVTPLSNNGEDTSLPLRFRPNPIPSAVEIALLQTSAAKANAGRTIELPNGVGFCLYISGAAADRIGPLSCKFERGYYEDVEFCLRAVELGYRNVCAADAYVAHHGGRSFGMSKRLLVVRNQRRLVTTYPDYLAKADIFERNDPLSEPIARIEEGMIRQFSRLDVLLLPQETPAILSKAIVARLNPSKDRNLVLAYVGEASGQLQIRFVGPDGTLPQNLIWTAAVSRTGENKLLRKLATLPIDRVAALDADNLPNFVGLYILNHERDLALFTSGSRPQNRQTNAIGRRTNSSFDRSRTTIASLAENLSIEHLPDIACFQPPKVAAQSGILAVLGLDSSDISLLYELDCKLPKDKHLPKIVVTGDLAGAFEDSFRDNILIAGNIDDEELPTWLGRLGPQAVLFADRRWGGSDPRATQWTSLPTARFDALRTQACQARSDLYLPIQASPEFAASAIAAWLASVSANPSSSWAAS